MTSPTPSDHPRRLGIWCHVDADFTHGRDAAARRMDQIAAAGVDFLLAYVTPEEGTFYYASDLPDIESEDHFSLVLELARERGIHVHPWVFPSSWVDRAPAKPGADGAYVSGKPGGHPRDGVFCGSWAPRLEPGVVFARDMLAHHPLEGLHLDVVRYREVDQCREWPCRCQACSRLYREYIGKDFLTADDLRVPGILFKFMQLRQHQIHGVVRRMKALADEHGVKLSLAARTDYFNWALLEGQDWVRWVREGLFDFVCTMNYKVERGEHRDLARLHTALTDGCVPLYDGIGRYSSMGELSPREMIQFADDAIEAGADGVAVFKLEPMVEKDFALLRSWRGQR